MILRNRKEIPHGPSRGLTRDPVVCDNTIDSLPHDGDLQASAENKLLYRGGVGCGNSNLVFELASSQASTSHLLTVTTKENKATSTSTSSTSTSSLLLLLLHIFYF